MGCMGCRMPLNIPVVNYLVCCRELTESLSHLLLSALYKHLRCGFLRGECQIQCSKKTRKIRIAAVYFRTQYYHFCTDGGCKQL